MSHKFLPAELPVLFEVICDVLTSFLFYFAPSLSPLFPGTTFSAVPLGIQPRICLSSPPPGIGSADLPVGERPKSRLEISKPGQALLEGAVSSLVPLARCQC